MEGTSAEDTALRSLHGRVAIVTGGAGAIGGAVSRHLASLGAKVVVNYFGDSFDADRLVAAVNDEFSCCQPPRAIAVQANVTDETQVKALFDAAELAFGPEGIHIVVTCAGVNDPYKSPLAELTPEHWDQMFLVNAKGTFLCCREAARRLVRGGGGRIITISSSTVDSLRPGYGAYAASKAAVEVLTKILSRELAGTGITANAVSPGPIVTPMFFENKSEEEVRKRVADCPLGRLGYPEDVARLVGYLVSVAGEFVNGQSIRINGGYI
ncbi:unnamed protein product [Spirodela intermedia]|uniref:Ketoreductase domain-containing protein n=1 Tax=Spirodela intermedia TaxID=51605 RepID=A0A7I8LKM0_SPIIN|nr:unnamed protein product [Spirodela intermedia]